MPTALDHRKQLTPALRAGLDYCVRSADTHRRNLSQTGNKSRNSVDDTLILESCLLVVRGSSARDGLAIFVSSDAISPGYPLTEEPIQPWLIRLLVAQRFDGIQARSLDGGIHPKE